ncbi:MAG TPA: hypothetical protein VEY93_15605, partial [Longimicrobium sp.]|nr:hypothetical protein [Longimicrobium sp.]
MVVLLIGLVCTWAVYQATRPAGLTRHHAFLCGAAITTLVLAQVWRADGGIRQYRVALLGMRYALAEPGVGLLDDTLRVGSDYDEADLYVNVPGTHDVARLWARGDSGRVTVLVSQVENGQAVVAVQGEKGLRIVGARPLERGETVEVVRPSPVRLTFERGRGTLPWREEHALRDATGRRVVVPPARLNWRDRLADRRPGPFQRTYPLADVLLQLDSTAYVGEISSFFYYDDGRFSFADRDSEVRV